jgi:hypothetical protein
MERADVLSKCFEETVSWARRVVDVGKAKRSSRRSNGDEA